MEDKLNALDLEEQVNVERGRGIDPSIPSMRLANLLNFYLICDAYNRFREGISITFGDRDASRSRSCSCIISNIKSASDHS